MRSFMIAAVSAAALFALPTIASAQNMQNNAAGGVAAGATAGAIGGAIVGGPIGAAAGAVIGGTVGGAAGAASEPNRVYVAPQPGVVVDRDCVQDPAGRVTCVERVR
ncbi:hypothetical protein [Prosthecomicrobium sp. N25]|uniref:hypothetical protein n=1 Tax=Prosthecomicrobium sp. N25 TaxID=3129254 RepID=UPI003077DDC3